MTEVVKLFNVFIGIYYIMPIIYSLAFNNVYSFRTYLISSILVAALFTINYSLISFLKRLNFNSINKHYFTQTYFGIALCLVFLLLLILLNIDADSLRISRESSRSVGPYIKILNVHVIIPYIVFLYYNHKKTSLAKYLLIAAIILSITIAFYEGRRTAAVFPFLLIFTYQFLNEESWRRINFRNLFFISTIPMLLIFISIIRLDLSFSQTATVLELIQDRIGNPGYILMRVIENSYFDFDPETTSKTLERLGSTFGLNEYDTNSNRFGRYIGLVKDNYIVAINPGFITEAFLAYGYIGFIFSYFLLISSVLIIYRFVEQRYYGLGIILVLGVLHGFQMEIPYTVGVIFKFSVFIFVIHFFKIIFLSGVRTKKIQIA